MSDLIEHLAQSIVQDNAILFVGSGLRRADGGPSAIDQVAAALAERIEYTRTDRSLAAVARDFEVLQGRQELIAAVREELERVAGSISPLERLIADAVLPYTKVITTRFDRILEQALDQIRKQYVLIVRDTDVPFFDESKITLIKMIGDIGQPESLVLTEDDIDAFIQRLPTVSDVIRAFFATKTLIFLGYDLEGELFKRVYRQVMRNLSAFQRPAYAIVAEPLDSVDARYWENQNVRLHTQDPFQFLEALSQAVKAAQQALEQPPEASLVEVPAPPLPAKPYKGLESFTSEDVAIFAGRTEEILRLTNRILARRITLLYGEAGSGKTSLLKAGSGPSLVGQRGLLAVCVPAPGQDLVGLAKQALVAAGEAAGLALQADQDLGGVIRECQDLLDGPVVVAMDSFETFFSAYSQEEQAITLGALNTLVSDRSLNLRLVFVIRDDELARVEPLEASLPGLMEGRFRLERLGREAARAAMEEPARLFGWQWEPVLIDRLLDELHAVEEGGVAPPQLQLVCDRLYQDALAETEAGPDLANRTLTLALLEQLGGTQGILGDHLDRTLASLPDDQVPLARRLLGALVSSAGLRQRLSLGALARAAEIDPVQAHPILDTLQDLGLVRRYARVAPETEPDYELTHDMLAPRIARWLGDQFWDAQRAREIVRQARSGWLERARLLPAEDVQFLNTQVGRVLFSPEERELAYASALTWGQDPEIWVEALPAEKRAAVLFRLADHPLPRARQEAALAMAELPGDAASDLLAEMAIQDSVLEVRHGAALAIARRPRDQRAIGALVAASGEPASRDQAQEALVAIWDEQPGTQAMLPAPLRREIRRQVLALRWQRSRAQVWSATLRGLQAGFWGLALGLGVFLSLWNARLSSGLNSPIQFYLGVLLFGMSLAGVLGALSVGAGSLMQSILRGLQGRPSPWRDWALVAGFSGMLFSLGLVLVGVVSAGSPRPWTTALAGLVIGVGIAGLATAPWKLPRLWRLASTGLVGAALFVLVGVLGWFFDRSFAWLILMGVATGVGYALGFSAQENGPDPAREMGE